MKYAKKVEIVIDALEVNAVVKILDEIKVSGYSIIRDVIGKGSRGVRGGDEFTDLFKNSYIMVLCEEKEMYTIVTAVTPIIKKFGGVCITSDVIVAASRR